MFIGFHNKKCKKINTVVLSYVYAILISIGSLVYILSVKYFETLTDKTNITNNNLYVRLTFGVLIGVYITIFLVFANAIIIMFEAYYESKNKIITNMLYHLYKTFLLFRRLIIFPIVLYITFGIKNTAKFDNITDLIHLLANWILICFGLMLVPFISLVPFYYLEKDLIEYDELDKFD